MRLDSVGWELRGRTEQPCMKKDCRATGSQLRPQMAASFQPSTKSASPEEE
jgi:hypothetical protein